MSDDEFLIAVTSGILALAYWGGWLTIATGTNRLARPAWRVVAVIGTVLGSLAVVFVTLVTRADPQVRSSAGYVVLFLAVAAVTLAAAGVVGWALGLPVLDGFVRDRNQAIGWAVASLWLGTGLVNAGANIGRGDTIYTTLGPLALALAALLVLVAILSAVTGRFRAIRLDRDTLAGVRVGALFIAWGLILGRAVAGDWESTRRTWEDFFAYGWPVLVLWIAAVPVEWALRPTVRRPQTSWAMGFVPAAAYLGAAAASVVFL